MSEVATIIPSQLVAILERPPLCVGEDRTQYDQLRDMLQRDQTSHGYGISVGL